MGPMHGGHDDPTGENLPPPPVATRRAGEPTPSVDPVPPVAMTFPEGGAATTDDASDTAPAIGGLAGDRADVATSVATVAAAPPPTDPVLPPHEARQPPAVTSSGVTRRHTEALIRTDRDRARSVRRRADPWYRRLARGVIVVAFVAVAGLGLFYGPRLVQDYLDRDDLPAEGADVPEIRATSFEIRSSTPAPVLDGTLTLDTETKAFEFTGRETGAQAGIEVVSTDGSTVLIRRPVGNWETAGAADQVAADVQRAAAYLSDDDGADALLTSDLRRGFVDVVDRAEIGETDDVLRRYDLRLDTDSFRDADPIEYQNFEDQAIPGVDAVRGLPVNITLDDQNVLVAVDDTGTNWSWRRLAYSDQPYTPRNPADAPFGDIVITDGNLGD